MGKSGTSHLFSHWTAAGGTRVVRGAILPQEMRLGLSLSGGDGWILPKLAKLAGPWNLIILMQHRGAGRRCRPPAVLAAWKEGSGVPPRLVAGGAQNSNQLVSSLEASRCYLWAASAPRRKVSDVLWCPWGWSCSGGQPPVRGKDVVTASQKGN